MPCADNEQASKAHNDYHQSEDNHGHDETADFCSPLCACNCCHTTIELPLLLSFFSDIRPMQEFNSFFLDHQSKTYFSIWQPPKIS